MVCLGISKELTLQANFLPKFLDFLRKEEKKENDKNCLGQRFCMHKMDLESTCNLQEIYSLPEFLSNPALAMGLPACTKCQEKAAVSTDKGVSPLSTFSSFVSWSVKQRFVLEIEKSIYVLAMGLSAWAEWILNFVQEVAAVGTDPQGS